MALLGQAVGCHYPISATLGSYEHCIGTLRSRPIRGVFTKGKRILEKRYARQDVRDLEDTELSSPGGKGSSFIAHGTTCQGNLKSEQDIYVDGRLEGDAHCRSITIGKTGFVKGTIIGDTVQVSGSIEGYTVAKTLRVMATAQVNGELTVHGNLSVEDGAQVDGTIKMGKPKSAANESKGRESATGESRRTREAESERAIPAQKAGKG